MQKKTQIKQEAALRIEKVSLQMQPAEENLEVGGCASRINSAQIDDGKKDGDTGSTWRARAEAVRSDEGGEEVEGNSDQLSIGAKKKATQVEGGSDYISHGKVKKIDTTQHNFRSDLTK